MDQDNIHPFWAEIASRAAGCIAVGIGLNLHLARHRLDASSQRRQQIASEEIFNCFNVFAVNSCCKTLPDRVAMNVSAKPSKPIKDATGGTAKSVVSLADYKASLSGAAPALRLDAPLAALWWAAKGQWDEAHRIVQDEDGTDSAWVHAYLHRVEGDLGNAGYWYRRAGKPVATGSLETEWERMVCALLGSGSA